VSGIPDERKLLMLFALLGFVWFLIWVLALVDILRRRDLRTSSKVLWALAALFVPIIGVVAYLIARPPDARQYSPEDVNRLQGDASYESLRDRHPV
jgi:phospholipase D-like protein